MKLLFITGSRADWNGLGMVAKEAVNAGHIVQVASAWGEASYETIAADGVFPRILVGPNAASAEMPDTPGTPYGTAAHAGLFSTAFAHAINSWIPDMVVLAGDRWEIHAAATAAALMTVPIAHIAGGDITRGSLDDKLRDSITMLSQFHFTTNDRSANRVMEMLGGAPVFNLGSPALDRIRTTEIVSQEALFRELSGSKEFKPSRYNILVAYHPDTLETIPEASCHEMLAALSAFNGEASFLVLGANADAGGDKVDRLLRTFADACMMARYAPNLPAQLYYSALTHFDLMVGNSSAGLYEAPSFGIPVVNIGDRQDGRIAAVNVASVHHDERSIRAAAIDRLRHGRFVDCKNHYGDGHSAPRIVQAISAITDPRALLRRAS